MEFEDNTRTRNHYTGDLNYHIIFSTKFRRKCLSEIENELYAAFRYCESKSNFKIKTMKQDKDHIHLLINIKPTYSLGQAINRMKQMTTNYLYRNEKTRMWLRNFYWAKRLTVWTHGYFASTVGRTNSVGIYRK